MTLKSSFNPNFSIAKYTPQDVNICVEFYFLISSCTAKYDYNEEFKATWMRNIM